MTDSVTPGESRGGLRELSVARAREGAKRRSAVRCRDGTRYASTAEMPRCLSLSAALLLCAPACSETSSDPVDASGSSTDTDAGTSDDETGSEGTGSSACDPGDGPVTLSLSDDVAAAEGWISGMTFVGETAVACGEGFAAVVVGGGSTALDGTCVGIAPTTDAQVVVATSADLRLLGVTTDGVEELGRQELADELFDVAADGDGTVVAATAGSLAAFELSGDSLMAAGTLDGPMAPRAIAWAGDGWLVADEDAGVMLVAPEGGVVASLPEVTGGIAVVVDGAVGLILRAGFGFDVVALDGGLQLQTSVPTEGTAVAGAIHDGVALVATGAALHRYELGDEVALSGRVVRPDYGSLVGGWFRAVAFGNAGAFASVGDGAYEVTVTDEREAGVLLLDRVTTSLQSDSGTGEAVVLLRNAGNGPLRVGEVDIASPFEIVSVDGGEASQGCEGHTVLAAGEVALVNVRGEVSGDGPELFEFSAETSDPAWPRLVAHVEANRPTVQVGTEVDFTGLTLDGDAFSLSSLRGEVVFLKLFAPS